ncbi:APC family permease [Rickettsia endosymbiont of Oedothorax gibbosus]|uniref:APC family permease n=1 Tax=Rickettsia endosymbiont of Oedothorax gibbosus TaxID=931099 RepID=UPI0020255FCD|nr:amino acid permease [Rickettsia endosymbiont of Oedothorax gibbosus]
MSQKLGFWSVFALVIGSQIGTSVLILPASLAPYGIFSLVGGVVSSCGAIILALLFAILCCRLPQTGGPHVYLKKAFGNDVAFFTGWTYWVISWVSTAVVVISAITYLTPLIGVSNSFVILILQILLLFAIMLLNLKGVEVAGRAEFILAILKFIPLIVVPIAALYQFDSNNFVMDKQITNLTFSQILGKVTLLTFWGFIGLESATAQAGSVMNPSKTIPRAVVIGTLCVAILYLINSVGIIGLIPPEDLIHSKAPYVDATQIIFGGQWHLLISLIASIICIGTLNAWVLISGQIALGLAQDGLMPSFFAKQNKNGAPIWSLVISCIGILLLLISTTNEDLSEQITEIIDFSVISFLFVYLACSVAFLKLLLTKSEKSSTYQWLIALGSMTFCLWIIYETPLNVTIKAISFVLSGIPVYLWYKKQSFLRLCKQIL